MKGLRLKIAKVLLVALTLFPLDGSALPIKEHVAKFWSHLCAASVSLTQRMHFKKAPALSSLNTKRLEKIINHESQDIEVRLDALDQLYRRALGHLTSYELDVERAMVSLFSQNNIGPELTRAADALRAPTITQGLSRSTMPAFARLNFRRRYLQILYGLERLVGVPLQGEDLSDFAHCLVELRNEACLYVDVSEPSPEFSPEGDRILGLFTDAIVEAPHLSDSLASVLSRIQRFKPVKGREHGSGRKFWGELQQRVNTRLTAGDRLRVGFEIGHANFEDVDANLGRNLSDWRIEVRKVTWEFTSAELEHGLSIVWSTINEDSELAVSLRLATGIIPGRSLIDHSFALTDDSGQKLKVFKTNHRGNIFIPLRAFAKHPNLWLSFEPSDRPTRAP
jgi:hypothetical protein